MYTLFIHVDGHIDILLFIEYYRIDALSSPQRYYTLSADEQNHFEFLGWDYPSYQ